jgi:3-oxoacyl-[acyl-carrier protein] reductase
MTMRLAGKVAVVTGAGSGFGAEMARRFVAEGARVVCADIDSAAAGSVALELGEAARGIGCDVSDDGDVAKLAAAAKEWLGRIDILVNNAAISQKPKRSANTSRADVERLFAVNVTSLLHAAVHLVPIMRAGGGGAIINMTSVTALRPRPGMTWYNATKAAVISVTQSMAGELAADGIRVNAIAPGVSRTPMFEAIFGAGDSADAAHDQLAASFPLGRLSQPSDIASAAVYLASEEASFVTGIVLPVDGGRLIG